MVDFPTPFFPFPIKLILIFQPLFYSVLKSNKFVNEFITF